MEMAALPQQCCTQSQLQRQWKIQQENTSVVVHVPNNILIILESALAVVTICSSSVAGWCITKNQMRAQVAAQHLFHTNAHEATPPNMIIELTMPVARPESIVTRVIECGHQSIAISILQETN